MKEMAKNIGTSLMVLIIVALTYAIGRFFGIIGALIIVGLVYVLPKLFTLSDDKLDTCALCDNEESIVGNRTNMHLLGYETYAEFIDEHDQLCAVHAKDETKKIVREKGLNKSDWQRAQKKAQKES